MGLAIASPRRAIPSLALAILVALAPASAPAGDVAPVSPRERSQVLLIEGDAAVERGELDEAISKYRSAYYGLAPSDQASYVGSLPVRKAMQAYDQSVARERDPKARRALLERQRGFLDEFLDGVAARSGAADEIGKDVMAELEDIRHRLDEALDIEQHDVVDPFPDRQVPAAEQDDGAAAKVEPALDQPDERHRDWLGLGLTIGGSTLLATGVGVSVGSWTIRKGARDLVDGGGEGYAEGTQARADYLAQEDARARKFLVAGTVVAGVGLATTIAGVVHVVVHRRRHVDRTAAVHVAPLFTPTATGIALHRRF